MIETVYKVCKREARKIISSHADKHIRVTYRWNKWNKPTNRGNDFLFVFRDMDAAVYFANCKGLAIYRARAKNVREGHPFSYPWGTMFCDSLKLVKKVKQV